MFLHNYSVRLLKSIRLLLVDGCALALILFWNDSLFGILALIFFNAWYCIELSYEIPEPKQSYAWDGKSRQVLVGVRDLALLAAVCLADRGGTDASTVALVGAGMLLGAVGVWMRWLAMDQLGKFFTMKLTVSDDHRLIEEGLYDWVRHPSYLGLILIYGSLPLIAGALPAMPLVVTASVAAVLYRISLEERMLLDALSEGTYRRYRARVGCLLPKFRRKQ